VTAGALQYLTIGALTGDNERYTLGGITLSVNGTYKT
jgi:hypothetical protein